MPLYRPLHTLQALVHTTTHLTGLVHTTSHLLWLDTHPTCCGTHYMPWYTPLHTLYVGKHLYTPHMPRNPPQLTYHALVVQCATPLYIVCKCISNKRWACAQFFLHDSNSIRFAKAKITVHVVGVPTFTQNYKCSFHTISNFMDNAQLHPTLCYLTNTIKLKTCHN